MARLYRSRQGQITAVDTKTQLTTLGSSTAPGPLLVPAGATKIIKIISHAISDGAAANDCSFLIRLEGPGLPEGPESFVVGGAGSVAATGNYTTSGAQTLDVDIPVTVSNEILIFAEMVGEDVGSPEAGVTLVFDSG